MRYLNALGLTLAVVIGVGAVAGAGTASATVLCKGQEAACSESNRLGKGTSIEAELLPETVSRLETESGFAVAECTSSTLTSVVEKPGGATETVFASLAASALTWSGCSSSVSTTSSGELEIHYISETVNGTLTEAGVLKQLAVSVGGCTYALPPGTHIGLVTGGAAGLTTLPAIDVHTRLNDITGPTCIEHLIWVATFRITKPTPLYVRAS